MSAPATLGWILAGGRGRRLGGDKAGRRLAGRPLLLHVLDSTRAQCTRVVVNGEPAALPQLPAGTPVVEDGPAGGLGPLAGLLTGLRHLDATAPDIAWLATFPVDTPFLPSDLVARLHGARGAERAVVCASGGRLHPTIGLWHRSLGAELARAVEIEGLRRAEGWAERAVAARLELGDGPSDPCFNINTPDDLETAERLLRQG